MSRSFSLPTHAAVATPRPAYRPLPPLGEPEPVPAFYAHMPFCTTKCHYCDFYSLAGHLDQADAFLDALQTEIALQVAHFGTPRPETIFIGGGTPTLLDPPRLARMLRIVTERLDRSELAEFTVEANPNTFDAGRAEVLVAAGVNRISFGAQSFVPAELVALQRDHDPESVPAAIALARQVGIGNLNLDLIFGIPGQTLESWDFSLRQALACEPQHMSCYSLMYEPNTVLTARLKRGEVQRCDEELELEMLQHLGTTLHAAGIERYEISNYARPGKRCRHNVHYWDGGNFLAVGPSASAHWAGHRWKNVASLGHYLDALRPGDAVVPISEMEHLTGRRRWGELAMLRLRMTDGLHWQDFFARTGLDARERLAPLIAKYHGLGLLHADDEHLALTAAAVPVSDTLLREALAAFE